MSKKRDHEARLIKLAREIAASGRHIGWWYVACELRFGKGEPLALEILDKEPVRAELDRICARSIKQKQASP